MRKEDKSNGFSRRRFIKRTSVGATAVNVGLIGSAGAQTKNSNEKERLTGEKTATIDTSEKNSMSESEFEDYAARMKRKYGDDLKGTIIPGSDEVSTQSPSPDVSGLTQIDAWNTKFKVKSDQTGITLANTDHAIAYYKANETDSNGNNHFLFWHWSQAEPVNQSKIKKMWSKTNVTSNGVNLVDFNPDETKTQDGKEYDVKLGGSYSNFSFSIGGKITLYQGEFGPKTGDVDLGEKGSFAVQYDGSHDGTTNLNGVCETQKGGSFDVNDYNFKVHVKASTFA